MAAKKSNKSKKPARKSNPKAKTPPRKPVLKINKAPASKAKTPVKKVLVAKKAPKTAVAVKKAKSRVAKASDKPIIRTGPSKIPTSFGKAPLSALGRGMIRPSAKVASKAKPLTKSEVQYYKELLLKLRDRVIDEISFLANDNLNRSAKESSGDLSSYSFHMADQGTDNFDREFAASLLNNEHDVLYEIEEALRRIEQGTYGVCEMSNRPIERERLKVLPFVRYCVAVQSEIERGKPRFRPFRRTSIQTAEAGTN